MVFVDQPSICCRALNWENGTYACDHAACIRTVLVTKVDVYFCDS